MGDGTDQGLLKMITVDELAEILSLSKTTLWRHRDSGLIPPGTKMGQAVRWRRSDIESWVENGCKPMPVDSD